MSIEFVDIEDRVDGVFGLEVLLTLDHSPHFVRLRVLGSEESSLSRGHVEQAIAV